MRGGHDPGNVRAKAVQERNAGNRHNQRVAIDSPCISFSRETFDRFEKLHASAARLLRQPDVTHGRELEFAHHYGLPVMEVERSGKTADACRDAPCDGDLLRFGSEKRGKLAARSLIVFDPEIPWRSQTAPRFEQFVHTRFNRIG